MANGGRIDYTIGFKADLSGLNSVRAGLKEIQNLTAQDYMIRFSTTNSLQQAERELETLKAQVAQIEVAYTKSFDSKLGVLNIQTLDKELSKAGIRTQNLFNTLAKVGQENVFNKMIEQATTANYKLKQTNDFLEDIGHTITSTIRWGIASRAMNEMVGSIKGSFGYIKNLDTSLNDIRIVTGKSADEMARFARESNRAASKLGQTTKTYTDASLIYYQQGLSDAEVQARTETTLKAANVTGQTGEEVSEQLTAVWNGYKVSAEEAELYVDKLAAVAATTASDLEELSTGMSKVASAASVMGVPIDQLNAMLATTISVTRQAPESIGTAYKTIFARIGDIEAGKGEVTLGQYTSKMKELGFNVLDANQKLKDQGDVVTEIGNNWNTLSREQQIALAQTMAGARQYNNLLALFDNWDMYTDALKTSADAAGTLNKQNETYLESTEAHLNKLTAAQEKFQSSLLDASTISDFSDVLSELLNILSEITDSIGGGKGLLLELGAIFTRVFNKQIAENLMPFINNFRNLRLNAEMTAATLNNIKLLSGLGIKDTTAISSLEASVTKNAPIMNTANNETKQQWIEAEAGRAKAQAEVDAARLRKTQTTEKMQRYGVELGIDFKGGDSGFSDQASQEILEKRRELASDLKAAYKDLNASVTENVNLELKGNQTIEEKIQDLQTTEDKVKEVSRQLEQSHNLDIISDEQYDDATRKLEAISSQIGTNKSILDNAQKLKGPAPSGAEKANAYQQAYKAFGWDKSTPDKTQKLESFISDRGIKLSTKKGYEDQLTQNSQKALKAYGKEVGMSEEQIKKFTQAIQKAIIETNKFAKAQKDAQNYTPTEEEQKAYVAEQAQAQRERGQGQPDVEETIEDIKGVTQATRQSNEAIRQSGEEATDAKNKVSAYEKVVKELTDDQRRLVNTQAWVKMASDLTMIASIANNIQALPNIWQNNDISDGEKVLQTITNIGSTLGVALPSIISNINAVRAAATGLQASLGVIGLVSAAIGLVVGGIQAVIQWQENERKARIEANKAIIEENNARLQEIDTNTKLYNSYSELEKNYKLGNASKQELLNSTDELIDAYDIENGRLLKMTGNYEALAAAIKKKRLEDAREKETKAKESLEASEKVLTDSTNFRYYSGSSIRASDSDDEYELQEVADALNETIEGFGAEVRKNSTQRFLVLPEKESITNLSDEQSKAVYEILKEYQNKGVKIEGNLLNYFESDEYKQVQENKQAAQQATFERTAYEKDLDSVTTFNEYEQKVEEIRKSMSNIKDEDFLKYVDELGTEFSQLYSAQQRLLANFGDNREDVEAFIKGLSAEELGQLVTVGLSGDETVEQIKLILKAVKGQLSTEDTTITMEVRGDLGSEKIADANEKLTEYTKLLDGIEKRGLLGQADILEDIGTKQIEKNSDYLKVFQMSGAEKDELKTSYQERINEIYNKDKVKTYEAVADKNTEDLYKVMNVNPSDLKFMPEYVKEIQQAMSDFGVSVSDFYDEEGKLREGITQEDIITKLFGGKEEVAKLKALRQQVEAMNKGIKAIDNALSGKEIQTAVFDLISEKSDEIITKFDVIAQMGESMGDGFVIAADKVEEFASKFPELLKDYKVLSDGSIKLSRDQLQATVGAIHAEQKAKAEAQIKELDMQIELNEMKIKMMEEQNALTLKFLQGDMDAETYKNEFTATAKKQEGELQDKLNKLGVDSTNIALDNLKDVATGVDALTEKFIKLSAVVSAAARGEDASQIAKEFADTVVPDMTSVTKEFLEGINSSKTMEDITSSEKMKAAYDQALKSYQLNLQQINLLKSETEQLKAQKVTIESGINASLAAINENLIDQLDLLDDVVDRYHDINNQLTQIEHIMNKINNEQEKSIGQDYINSLASQNKLLDTQIEKLRQKKDIQLAEAEELRGKLATKGFLFNEDGSMANYETALQANIDLMRTAQMSGDKDKAEQYEKQYNKMKEWLERYDTLYNDEMPQLEEDITDSLNQKIENNIKKFNYQLELHVDLKELRKEFADFQKDLLNDKDYTGNLQIQADYLTNPDTLNLLGEQSQHVQDIMAEIQKMESGQESDIFGDNLAAAYEELKTATKNLEDGTIDIKQAFDEALDTYLSMIDLTSEAMNEEKNLYDKIDELLTSRKNVISLVYGEESYKDFEMYYELQRKNNLESLNAARESANYWSSVMDKEEEGSEAWLKAKDNWQEAVSTLNSEIEQSITNLKEGYNNAIQSIFQEVNNQISGGKGLDNLKYEWDYVLEQSERYLDNVDKSYEISKLNSSINKQLNNTTSASTRQRLLDFQKKELDYLEKKDQLSQYDIDRSNKKLEILQAQIALEDAQNNKSQMRLRRDSQGNYSYQYVADTTAVDDAKDKLDTAIHDLYTLDKDRLKNTTQEWYNAWTSMQEELNEATQKYTGEALEERTKQIQEKYKDVLDSLSNDVNVSLTNLNQSSLVSLAEAQQQAKISTKSLVDYLTGSEGSGKLEKSFKDALSNIGVKEQEILPPIANADLPAVAGAAGRTESALNKMFDEVNRESAKFQSNLNAIETASGESFSSYITNAGTAYNKTKNLVNKQKELITQYKEKLGIGRNLLNSLDNVKNKFDNMKISITGVITEANKLFGNTYGIDLDTSGFTTAVDDIIAQIGRITTALGDIDYSKLGNGGITSNSGDSSTDSKPSFQNTVQTNTYKLNSKGFIDKDNSIGYQKGSLYLGGETKKDSGIYQMYDIKGNTQGYMQLAHRRAPSDIKAYQYSDPTGTKSRDLKIKKGTEMYINAGYNDKMYQVWYNKDGNFYLAYLPKDGGNYFKAFDTGGYTGNWNSKEGRMAMLHEKELVLNAKDTKNILAAVNSVRTMQSIITSLDLNALAIKKQMISNLTSPIIAKEGLTNNNLDQNVQIEANFPNVRDARQIEEAFDNLVNMASQYANKQTR